MKTLLEEVKGFDPYNEQEEADKELLMTYLTMFDDIFYRENLMAHMTSSPWIVNQDMSLSLIHIFIMLGQTPILYSGTIADNLQIGLRLSEQPLADENRLLAYLDKVGLHKELNDTCEKLSGGEKQRLCLARVLLMDADVYLADEPSSAMDKETESFVIDNLVTFVKEHDKRCV